MQGRQPNSLSPVAGIFIEAVVRPRRRKRKDVLVLVVAKFNYQ